MISNPSSIVAAFVAALEAVLGLVTIAAALRALRRPAGADDAVHFPVLLAATVAGLCAASWPLFYLTLQSYVGRWPGVMCIQGVLRVGAGSEGAPGGLPALATALSILRPAAVLAAGSWIVLHLSNRGTRTAPLTRRVLAFLALSGALAAAAGGAELAYLLIPKEQRVLADGCCTVPANAFLDAPGFRPFLGVFGEDGERAGTSALFFGGALVLAIATALLGRRPARALPPVVAAAAACAFLVVALGFANEVASPVVLHLPHHHCVWCLFAQAPETLAGAALAVLGAFATIWAALAAPAARAAAGDPATDRRVRALLRSASFGFAGALVFFAVEILVA